jgi:hypothetical protein
MDNKNFNWDELLEQIHLRNIIPVIGQGLYWARTDKNHVVPLYQHLAVKLAEEIGFPLPEYTNHTFSRMVFQYLKERRNDYLGLRHFLVSNFASLAPLSFGPLWKLAQIRPFSLFINTTYDHFLEYTLNSVRNYPTEVIHHTNNEKRISRVTNEQLEKLENSNSSLVFHIYGSTAKNLTPAYIEKDILETLITFQKEDKNEEKEENHFFQTLREKSLLFIGCGYDDWLFRFFIRTIANEPYQVPSEYPPRKFISDDFNSLNCGELACFLKEYDSEVFFSGGDKSFVDMLFIKMNSQYEADIIPEDEFPDTVFISFHGANRDAAVRLASNLREDGIRVWLDQSAMKPSDRVDKTIIRAIDKCKVFIPIISEEARQIQDDNMTKYHIREWEWAYSHNIRNLNPRFIMPVKIDDTKWIYEPFKPTTYIHIPEGQKDKDYNKLKNHLSEIQEGNTR